MGMVGAHTYWAIQIWCPISLTQNLIFPSVATVEARVYVRAIELKFCMAKYADLSLLDSELTHLPDIIMSTLGKMSKMF